MMEDPITLVLWVVVVLLEIDEVVLTTAVALWLVVIVLLVVTFKVV